MTAILISGFVGAILGFGVDRFKGMLDRRQQSRAIATALRFELKWAGAVCQQLIKGWGPAGAHLPNPVDMLPKSSEYVTLFHPNDVALLLKANGMWQYLMEQLGDIRQQYAIALGSSPEARPSIEHDLRRRIEEAREYAPQVFSAMVRADERLLKAKGAPDMTLLRSSTSAPDEP